MSERASSKRTNDLKFKVENSLEEGGRGLIQQFFYGFKEVFMILKPSIILSQKLLHKFSRITN